MLFELKNHLLKKTFFISFLCVINFVFDKQARGDILVEGGLGGATSTQIAVQNVTSGVVPALLVGVGWQWQPRSVFKARFTTFEADGANQNLTLGVEYDLFRNIAGLLGQAGLSHGSRTGFGNIIGIGLYARVSLHPVLRIRAESTINTVFRNDLGGLNGQFFLILEWKL